MGKYRIFQCRTCGTTVLSDWQYSWHDFSDLEQAVACCQSPRISWAKDWVEGTPDEITLPDNEDMAEPEFPRLSRIELVLEEINHG
jgi:hypothetical protein